MKVSSTNSCLRCVIIFLFVSFENANSSPIQEPRPKDIETIQELMKSNFELHNMHYLTEFIKHLSFERKFVGKKIQSNFNRFFSFTALQNAIIVRGFKLKIP
jgi:hypothetical protein